MLVLLHGVTELLCSLGLPSRLSDITGEKVIFSASIFGSFSGESNDFITKGIEKVDKTKYLLFS